MQSNSSFSPGSQQLPSSRPLPSSCAPLCALSCRLCHCWGPRAVTCMLYNPAGHCFSKWHWGKAHLWLLLPRFHINVILELVLFFSRLHELSETSLHPWEVWLHLMQRSASGKVEMKDWQTCHEFVGSAGAGCGTIFRKPGWEQLTFSKKEEHVSVRMCKQGN